MTDSPLLIACSDVHLSENPPSFRSTEDDWFMAQARQLRWLKALGRELHCPIVVAGDIFDKAMGTTRLVNFAADEFPFSYAVAGNHDLPYHNLERVAISSYGTLIRAKKVVNIDDVVCVTSHGVSIALHGFSYGVAPRPCQKHADIDVAVVHRFVWSDAAPCPMILSDSHIRVVKAQMPGYDFYIFGDNHGCFVDGNVINCGAFYRRCRGDENWNPKVGLIYRDRIELLDIPVGNDSMNIVESGKKGKTARYDFSEFFDSLRQAESLTCDVDQLLQDYLRKHQVEPDVNTAIIHITES